MLLTLDHTKLPPFTFTRDGMRDGIRDDNKDTRSKEAEISIVNWLNACEHKAERALNPNQKGYDFIITTDNQQYYGQTKQRTGVSWHIDNLRPNVYNEGLVQVFAVVQTKPVTQILDKIYFVLASRIYSSTLYFSEFNKRSQLGNKAVCDLASYIYDHDTATVIRDDPIFITKEHNRSNTLLEF